MRKNKWTNFQISCSSIKDIMSPPRGCTDLTKSQRMQLDKIFAKEEPLTEYELQTVEKLKQKQIRFNDPELSVAAKKYLISRYCWAKYNRGTLPTYEKSSFLIKGNELEGDAIAMVALRDETEYIKGTEFIYNDFIFGRCDIFSKEKSICIDVKVNWGIHGYLPNHIATLPAKYWYQMQGYLELYDLEYGEVCYVLLNTPTYLLEREKGRHQEKYLLGELTTEKYEEEMEKLDLCYDYSKIPSKRKIITFKVKREPTIMPMVYKKVERCRTWLKEFDKLHSSNKKIITSLEDYTQLPNDEEDNS